jgi:hypothetical protein
MCRIVPCNDEMRDGHSNAAHDENCLAAEFIDVQHGWNGGQEHDDTDNTSCEKRKRSTLDACRVKVGSVEFLRHRSNICRISIRHHLPTPSKMKGA